MIKVKVCGLTRSEDASLAAGLGAWALGVIFVAESPRWVTFKTASAVVEAGRRAATGAHGPEPLLVGVFVNTGIGEIEEAVRTCGLSAVQLHGEESPEFCTRLQKRLGVTVIKAIRVSGPEDVASVVRFDTDFVLLDTYHPEHHGGTGKSFDWSLASYMPEEDRQRRLVLSGGLDPENVAAAVRQVAPYAVDACSGIEAAPGIKDPEKLKQFFEAVRIAETE